MVGIVVIMISTLGVAVLNTDGTVDEPHVNIQTIVDTGSNSIYITHGNGEPVCAEEMKLVVTIDGVAYTVPPDMIPALMNNQNTWKLGDTIILNTKNLWGIQLKGYDQMDICITHPPSQTVMTHGDIKATIQPLILPDGSILTATYWIPPFSKVADHSYTPGGVPGSARLSDVMVIGDGNSTVFYPAPNRTSYQLFDFGMSTHYLDILNIDYDQSKPDEVVFSNVKLKIVYTTHDASIQDVLIHVWDESDGTYHNYTLAGCPSSYETYDTPLPHITTLKDIQGLKIYIDAIRNTGEAEDKYIGIDYLAIHLEN